MRKNHAGHEQFNGHNLPAAKCMVICHHPPAYNNIPILSLQEIQKKMAAIE